MNIKNKLHLSKITCAFIILALLPISSFAQFGPTTNLDNVSQKWMDVDYAGDGLQGHKMDIYLPKDGNEPYPVIVTIWGSAWFSNNVKQSGIGRCSLLLDKGFALVAVNHRASSEAIFPSQINDIKGAVRFLRANVSKYRLDPGFIGIMGDSSGGHLAALMETSGGVKEYTIGEKTLNIEGDIGGNIEESSRVDVVVDLYGPTLFYKMNSQRIEGGMDHDEANSPESSFIGAPIQ
jgi:hypothetical protein